jgi:hypothetical protein
MNTFNIRPSAAVRAAVLATSMLMATFCLGGVALGFTWNVPSYVVVTQNATPARA